MEENNAIIGILVIMAISVTAYFVVSTGTSGAAVQPYMTCCCNILADNGQQVLVRSQLQTMASRQVTDCQSACSYNYAGQGKIFSQEGTCADNP